MDRKLEFRHCGKSIHHTTVHQAEVTSVASDRRAGQTPDCTIEAGSGCFLEQAFAVPPNALTIDYFRSLIHDTHHGCQQLGRVLKVCVDQHHAFTARQDQPGRCSELMAVIPCQSHRGGWPTRNSVSPSISGSPADWFRLCRCRLLRKKGVAQTEQRPTTAAKFMLPLAAARG